MIERDKLDIYNNSAIILDTRTPMRIISWVTILIILFLIFIAFSFIPFNIYKTYYAKTYGSNDEVYFLIKLEYSDFPISESNKLYIKGKEYNYKILRLEENSIVLDIDIDESFKINNNIFLINILSDRTTLFKIICNKIKKGFGI